MRNYQYVKLSSKYTKSSFWLLILMMILIFPLVIGVFFTAEFGVNMLIAGVIFCGTIAMGVFALMTLCEAEIIDNQFHFRKFYKKEKEVYDLSQLIKLTKYENRRDDFLLLTISDNGKSHKFLLSSSRFILYEENLNSEIVLCEIIEHNQINNN